MQLASVLLLALCGIAAAVPSSFVKVNNAVAAGWSKVTSKSSMQRLLSEAEWRALWEDGMRVVNVREEISDDEDEAEAALQWTRDHDDDDNDGSGDDDRPEREGVCIHRSTLHSIERGSIEVNHDLCLLCVCQLSGSLHCIHTC